MPANEDQRRVDQADLAVLREPYPQRVVAANRQLLVITADCLKQLPRYGDARLHDERLAPHQWIEKPALDRRPTPGSRPGQRSARFIDHGEACIAPRARPVGAQRRQLKFELLWLPRVVRVQNATNSPRASRRARLRTAGGLAVCASQSTLIRGRSSWLRRNAFVSASEPSSAISSSQPRKAARRYCSRLNVGMMIDTVGRSSTRCDRNTPPWVCAG